MSNERNRYKWDDETKDDTPSEFSTTTYSTSAGAFHSTWSQDQRRYRRSARRSGLLWVVLAVGAASVFIVYALAPLLHR